jgi:hypothetical protein
MELCRSLSRAESKPQIHSETNQVTGNRDRLIEIAKAAFGFAPSNASDDEVVDTFFSIARSNNVNDVRRSEAVQAIAAAKTMSWHESSSLRSTASDYSSMNSAWARMRIRPSGGPFWMRPSAPFFRSRGNHNRSVTMTSLASR